LAAGRVSAQGTFPTCCVTRASLARAAARFVQVVWLQQTPKTIRAHGWQEPAC